MINQIVHLKPEWFPWFALGLMIVYVIVVYLLFRKGKK